MKNLWMNPSRENDTCRNSVLKMHAWNSEFQALSSKVSARISRGSIDICHWLVHHAFRRWGMFQRSLFLVHGTIHIPGIHKPIFSSVLAIVISGETCLTQMMTKCFRNILYKLFKDVLRMEMIRLVLFVFALSLASLGRSMFLSKN